MKCKSRPRLKNFEYIGRYTYFLTFCTASRNHLFTGASLIEAVLSQFLRTAAVKQMKQIAYVFMPDHVHLLVRGLTDASDLRDYVKAAKQKTGFDYRQQHGKHLWQPSFYDHILRGDQEEWSIIRYMVLNPVKAGLVQHPRDYPYWNAAEWTREEVIADLAAHPDDVWSPCGEHGGHGGQD